VLLTRIRLNKDTTIKIMRISLDDHLYCHGILQEIGRLRVRTSRVCWLRNDSLLRLMTWHGNRYFYHYSYCYDCYYCYIRVHLHVIGIELSSFNSIRYGDSLDLTENSE
jgi:hypothetical protein